jgi:hypothetical protein
MWPVDNPHGNAESNSEHLLSLNVWYGLIGDLLIGPFILKQGLTGANYLIFLAEESAL